MAATGTRFGTDAEFIEQEQAEQTREMDLPPPSRMAFILCPRFPATFFSRQRNVTMADDHQLSVMVESFSEHPERYRWVLLREGVVKARSLVT